MSITKIGLECSFLTSKEHIVLVWLIKKQKNIYVMEELDENDSILKSTKKWNEVNKKMENDINLKVNKLTLIKQSLLSPPFLSTYYSTLSNIKCL